MKAPQFKYLKAQSLDDVFAALDQPGEDVKILAGGQSLVPTMNLRLAAPDMLVDINGLKPLAEIVVTDQALRIGGLARHAEIGDSTLVAKHAPLLARAVPHVAHAGVRNRGTIGGSLVNADPASEFPACMLALGANINLLSQAGTRTIPASELFLGTYFTAIEPHEILTSVDIPISQDSHRSAFGEISLRSGDYALTGLAAHARVEDERLFNVRLAFFGVSDQPKLAPLASQALEGEPIGPESITSACAAVASELAMESSAPISAEYRLHLTIALCRKLLQSMSRP